MRALTASRGIARDAALPKLLGVPVSYGLKARPGDVVVGWGEKDNTERARAYAHKNHLPYWRLEDGFIGYLNHPAIDNRRLSLVVDKCGIYYDAHGSSDLEKLLNSDDWITPELMKRSRAAMARMRRWRISKYNQSAFDLSGELEARLDAFKGPKVLVVDQTFGDKSIQHGMGSDTMFKEMLTEALEENPTSLVVVKVHPDVMIGTKQGHFDIKAEATRDNERILFVAEDCNPHALMDKVDHVYVVTSQLGFEGLLAGKKVTCFGVPFYAGWGLTHDRQLCENRATNRSLEQLFAAAFILYCRYLNPFTGEVAELEDILDILVAERQMTRPNAARFIAAGFSLWKRGFLPEFFGSAVQKTIFTTPCALEKFDYQPGDSVVVWGRNHDKQVLTVPSGVPVWRMEDGFLRSVGLGSDLRRPSSLVFDQTGIYYDGSAPSDLETFLNTHDFDAHDLRRGAVLRDNLLNLRVSKYNVGEQAGLDFKTQAAGRLIILVPGQVEGDASLEFGSPQVNKNADLLLAVRGAHPDAFIVYKPHPDVMSGNRTGHVAASIVSECADVVVENTDIIDCLDAVDSVHTMTSLTGFEALLRGLEVVTYGMPFYAGWGLTTDRMVLASRTAKLSLDALVYGVLCVYARYVAWPSGKGSGPEALVAALAATDRPKGIGSKGPVAAVMRWGRKAVYLAEALRR
jgi:capsular polysaccharide export protein